MEGQNRSHKKKRNFRNLYGVRHFKIKVFEGHHTLTALTVLSTIVACIIGLTLRAIFPNKHWSKRELMYIQFPGDLFLRMLKVLIIPLLTCSIVSAIGSLDLSLSKKIGLQSILFYVTTTSVAVVQGIFWVLLISPGDVSRRSGSHHPVTKGDSQNVTTADTLLDLVRNMVPSNIVEACSRLDRTHLTPPKINGTNEPNWNANLTEWDIGLSDVRGTNVLGLVGFSIVLGITLAKMGREGRPVLKFIDSFGEAIMRMTKGVIWLSPLGILFLVVNNVLEMKSFEDMITHLGMYFITVLIGLLVHGFITVPAIYVLCTGEIPYKFIMNMGPAIATAFGTASSSASLPVSMQCLEENNKIDARVSRFVMPIGATINMDGTALYEAVAAIFISQYREKNLDMVDLLAVSITATMASIGAAGIPQAGLVTMVMVLDVVGLPAQDVGLILAVDWLLDRFRTVVNVLGDAIGGGIVAKLSKAELEKMTAEDQRRANAEHRPSHASHASHHHPVDWNNTAM